MLSYQAHIGQWERERFYCPFFPPWLNRGGLFPLPRPDGFPIRRDGKFGFALPVRLTVPFVPFAIIAPHLLSVGDYVLIFSSRKLLKEAIFSPCLASASSCRTLIIRYDTQLIPFVSETANRWPMERHPNAGQIYRKGRTRARGYRYHLGQIECPLTSDLVTFSIKIPRKLRNTLDKAASDSWDSRNMVICQVLEQYFRSELMRHDVTPLDYSNSIDFSAPTTRREVPHLHPQEKMDFEQ